ncbi:hypothetical protein ACFVHQ_18570 [Actinomycetes bacterium NPDC127524]
MKNDNVSLMKAGRYIKNDVILNKISMIEHCMKQTRISQSKAVSSEEAAFALIKKGKHVITETNISVSSKSRNLAII